MQLGQFPAHFRAEFLQPREQVAGEVNPEGTADLAICLPDYIAKGIRDGILAFSAQMKGYDLADAVLTAVESRSSSPVRILRNEDGESVSVGGIYPVGEGAGYAGGIVSAAIDGMRASERIIRRYRPSSI